MRRIAIISAVVGLLFGGSYVVAQDTNTWIGNMFFRQANPVVSWNGVMTQQGIMGGSRKPIVTAASGTTALTTAQSSGLVINTGTSGTTIFTLPTAATSGLNYCFVENGDANGELLINVQAGQNVVGKTQPSETGTGISTASGTGIKNTTATNVKGDFVCLASNGITSWVMIAQAGVWATQ